MGVNQVSTCENSEGLPKINLVDLLVESSGISLDDIEADPKLMEAAAPLVEGRKKPTFTERVLTDEDFINRLETAVREQIERGRPLTDEELKIEIDKSIERVHQEFGKPKLRT